MPGSAVCLREVGSTLTPQRGGLTSERVSGGRPGQNLQFSIQARRQKNGKGNHESPGERQSCDARNRSRGPSENRKNARSYGEREQTSKTAPADPASGFQPKRGGRRNKPDAARGDQQSGHGAASRHLAVRATRSNRSSMLRPSTPSLFIRRPTKGSSTSSASEYSMILWSITLLRIPRPIHLQQPVAKSLTDRRHAGCSRGPPRQNPSRHP
jgi:hypothetical protein